MVLHRLFGLVILATAMLVIISGLDWYNLGFGEVLPFHQHLRYDIYLTISAIVHIGISVKLVFMKKPLLSKKTRVALVNVSIVAIAILALFLVTYADSPRASGGSGLQGEDTIPTELAQVEVGSEEFVFDPTEVETIRPDLFNPGFFSTFDVLVHRELRWIPVSLLAGGKRIAARRGKSVCLSRAFSWITAAWAYKG